MFRKPRIQPFSTDCLPGLRPSLRASPLEGLGLTLALRNLAESAANRAGVVLRLELPTDLEKLAPDVEQCIFRVAQKSLENIVRHAEAQRIAARLYFSEGSVRNYVSSILSKLNIADHTQAAVLALRCGLVDSHE